MATAAGRKCGTEPLEDARSCHESDSPVEDAAISPTTRARAAAYPRDAGKAGSDEEERLRARLPVAAGVDTWLIRTCDNFATPSDC